jgi:hypothetical protein
MKTRPIFINARVPAWLVAPKDPGHWQGHINQGHVTPEEGGKLQRRGRSSDRPPAQRVL